MGLQGIQTHFNDNSVNIFFNNLSILPFEISGPADDIASVVLKKHLAVGLTLAHQKTKAV